MPEKEVKSLTAEQVENVIRELIDSQILVDRYEDELDELIESGQIKDDSRQEKRFRKRFINRPSSKAFRLIEILAEYAYHSPENRKIIDPYFMSINSPIRGKTEEEQEEIEETLDSVFGDYKDALNDRINEEVEYGEILAIDDEEKKNASENKGREHDSNVLDKDPKEKSVEKAKPAEEKKPVVQKEKEPEFNAANAKKWLKEIVQTDILFNQRFRFLNTLDVAKREIAFENTLRIKDKRDRLLETFIAREARYYKNKAVTDSILNTMKPKNVSLHERQVGERICRMSYNQEDCKKSVKWLKEAIRESRREKIFARPTASKPTEFSQAGESIAKAFEKIFSAEKSKKP